jgi:hypothetical protein
VFVLNGHPLPLDVPFEAGNTLYPANWLRLASPEERTAIGITEVPDPPSPYYDQRFYWGYTASGTLIPKDHGVLVSGWVDQTRTTANTLLSPSDWAVVRMVDNGTPVPSGVQSWRQTVRTCCNEKVVYITTTTTTDELATYITGSGYPVWPPQEQPIVVSETSTGSTSGSGLTGVSADAIFIGVSSTGGISSSVLFGSSGEDTIIL